MKKVWTVIIICVAAVVLLGGGGTVGYAVLRNANVKAADGVIAQIQAEDFDADGICASYNAMNGIAKSMETGRIAEAFTQVVSESPYQKDDSLVNLDAVAQYKEYKKVADLLGVSSEKIREYIDLVLQLEEYDDYDGLIACVDGTRSLFKQIESNLECASEEQRKGNYRFASNYASDALDAIYDTSDVLSAYLDEPYCKDYAMLYTDLVGVVFSGGSLGAINDIQRTIDRADRVKDAVKNIEKKLNS